MGRPMSPRPMKPMVSGDCIPESSHARSGAVIVTAVTAWKPGRSAADGGRGVDDGTTERSEPPPSEEEHQKRGGERPWQRARICASRCTRERADSAHDRKRNRNHGEVMAEQGRV